MDRFYPQPVELIELGEDRYFIKMEKQVLMKQFSNTIFNLG